MIVAVAIALLVAFSIGFHFFGLAIKWWMTPIASNWQTIDNAFLITFWICGFFFVVLNLFMAYSIWRFRARKGHTAHYEPENAGLEKGLTVWTGVGIAAMLAPGLLAWNQYVNVPKDAATVEVLGQQWQWSYRFPGRDGVLGTAATRFITPYNTFGINPNDPYGRDDILVESPELHLPIDKSVKVILRSKDVLHDFYVPEFRAKMDMVPGSVTFFWLTPIHKGNFDVLCAELCGINHFMMRGNVVVDDQKTFDDWLSQQQTFAQASAEAAAAPAATPPAAPAPEKPQ